jgi:H+-transporting ATPase
MSHLKFDLENGSAKEEARRDASFSNEDLPGDNEYTKLVRYISTYHDTRDTSKAAGDGDDGEDKCMPAKRHWWSFGGRKSKDGGAGFETPPEWLDTDLKTGLSSAVVEQRRKKTGWNELVTEKENLFLKFLGYFTGPILYGL